MCTCSQWRKVAGGAWLWGAQLASGFGVAPESSSAAGTRTRSHGHACDSSAEARGPTAQAEAEAEAQAVTPSPHALFSLFVVGSVDR